MAGDCDKCWRFDDRAPNDSAVGPVSVTTERGPSRGTKGRFGIGQSSHELVRIPQRSAWCCGLLWAVGIAILPVSLQAQEVQADPPVSTDTNLVEFEVSGNAVSGVSSLAIVNGRLSFERLDTVYYELEASVHGSYGASNDQLIAKNWGARVSFDTTPRRTLSLFSFVDIEQNPVRKLTLRTRMGTGAKWVLMRKSDMAKTSFSTALLAAYENHEIDGDDPQSTTLRMSFRLKTDMAVAPKFNVSATWFFQPRIDSWDDYLVDGFVRLEQELTEILSLNFTLQYLHDSDPPPEVQNYERRFLFGVSGKF